jgi:hypothetical protein
MALLDLKKLVESAAEKIRVAEREHPQSVQSTKIGHVVGQISQTPLESARTEALLAIAEATSLYGNIPQELPINGLAA